MLHYVTAGSGPPGLYRTPLWVPGDASSSSGTWIELQIYGRHVLRLAEIERAHLERRAGFGQRHI
jgi:hypothetical protein